MEAALPKVSYDEYVARERGRDIKHEYLDGVERAMGGGSIEHGRLAARITALLGRALEERPCEIFSSDVRIRVEATNRSLYPDLSVVCGPVQHARDDEQAIANPVLVVEVLSDSTEAYDRGEKFRQYKRLPTFREYLLVSQAEPLIEVFRRDGDAWAVTEHGPGTTVQLESVGAQIAVDAVFRRSVEG